MIVRCFKRGLFADDPDILSIGYNEIVRRGVRDVAYVEVIVKKYENLYGKMLSNVYKTITIML